MLVVNLDDAKEVEIEIGYEFCSMYVRSFNKVVKCVRGGVGVGVGDR